jgi:hypothetical protein
MFFCSLSCNAIYKNKHLSPEQIEKRRQNFVVHRYDHSGNTYTKKGDFTYHLHKCRHRKRDFDLDESYLASLWKQQNGKCAITNCTLIPARRDRRKTPATTSLDRIDSNRGYVKGNVQFVAYSVNMAKNDFDDQTIRDFFLQIQKSPARSL